MNANSDYSARRLSLSVYNTKATVAALFVSVIAFSQAQAQSTPPTQGPSSYTVTDLGTLGGSTSTASSAGGLNLAGIIVGSSTVSDGSEHAFLFIGGQMYDLNFLCDLSTSNFKVLTVAKTIDDCLEIVGEGITLNGDKHAFLLTPTPVDGGRWCYSCCQWIWKQEGVDGGGNRIVVVTNGMALRDITLRVRLGHRLAGGGRFPVVRSVRHRHRLRVGAVSTERSSRLPRRNAGRGAVSATVPEKKHSGIVNLAGAASTDSSTRRPRRIAGSVVVNATAPQKRRLSITKIVNHRPVGAASMDRWSRPPRRIAASAVVNVTVPEKSARALQAVLVLLPRTGRKRTRSNH